MQATTVTGKHRKNADNLGKAERNRRTNKGNDRTTLIKSTSKPRENKEQAGRKVKELIENADIS